MTEINRYLAPGTPVRVRSVDPYGMCGREAHPPIGTPAMVPRKSGGGRMQSNSPVNGLLAYIVQYDGWDYDGGKAMCIRTAEVRGGWMREAVLGDFASDASPFSKEDNLAASEVYDYVQDNDDAWDSDLVVHFYTAVVPGFGAFEFVDYELEEA